MPEIHHLLGQQLQTQAHLHRQLDLDIEPAELLQILGRQRAQLPDGLADLRRTGDDQGPTALALPLFDQVFDRLGIIGQVHHVDRTEHQDLLPGLLQLPGNRPVRQALAGREVHPCLVVIGRLDLPGRPQVSQQARRDMAATVAAQQIELAFDIAQYPLARLRSAELAAEDLQDFFGVFTGHVGDSGQAVGHVIQVKLEQVLAIQDVQRVQRAVALDLVEFLYQAVDIQDQLILHRLAHRPLHALCYLLLPHPELGEHRRGILGVPGNTTGHHERDLFVRIHVQQQCDVVDIAPDPVDVLCGTPQSTFAVLEEHRVIAGDLSELGAPAGRHQGHHLFTQVVGQGLEPSRLQHPVAGCVLGDPSDLVFVAQIIEDEETLACAAAVHVLGRRPHLRLEVLLECFTQFLLQQLDGVRVSRLLGRLGPGQCVLEIRVSEVGQIGGHHLQRITVQSGGDRQAIAARRREKIIAGVVGQDCRRGLPYCGIDARPRLARVVADIQQVDIAPRLARSAGQKHIGRLAEGLRRLARRLTHDADTQLLHLILDRLRQPGHVLFVPTEVGRQQEQGRIRGWLARVFYDGLEQKRAQGVGMQRHGDKQQQEQQEGAPGEAHCACDLTQSAREGFAPTLHSSPRGPGDIRPAGIGLPDMDSPQRSG